MKRTRKIIKQLYWKFIFTSSKVSNYFSNEDKTSHELKSNVVYEYKCSKDKSI